MKLYIGLVCCCVLLACSKKDKDYEHFLEGGEIVYPGVIANTSYRAGDQRVQLYWNPSPDPNVKEYHILWNNNQDSLVVPAATFNPKDTVRVTIPGLAEYVYSFTVYSYDQNGNRSIPMTVNNVRVYGPVYTNGLLNRAYNADNPYSVSVDGKLTLNFNQPDTINIHTAIRYTNRQDQLATVYIGPTDNSITIDDYKFGTSLDYRSAYVPMVRAIDTFNAPAYSEFPTVTAIVMMDKSKFAAMKLDNDVSDAWGWVMSNLWNGYSNESQGAGFHSADYTAPASFTFDMGQAASLKYFRLWSRASGYYNYGNLKTFELYGSNAPVQNGDWSAWTLMGHFTSHKPSGTPVGTVTEEDKAFQDAGESFDFPAGLPAYRYLRVKVIETWGSTNYCHLMELSFFTEL
ncbi:MAG: DUF4998 domain-containing protein [Candidatus Pseudobacter hemicellulosilyticus]|uniref:DUF4998 domain-containing protein n=1 Tax=Candidatus Pseudobacter hemicellulosilyticus TaxID=3121375 RepID=A0AAJ5WRI9_9BACT|nr:MAG: DUF4998 domain-containing protein [Pseudobacter sp.]